MRAAGAVSVRERQARARLNFPSRPLLIFKNVKDDCTACFQKESNAKSGDTLSIF
jgi:hypothetical protein